MDNRRIYRYLQLSTFSELEFHAAFTNILQSTGSNENDDDGSPAMSSSSSLSNEDEDGSDTFLKEAHVTTFLEQRIQVLEGGNYLQSAHDTDTTTYLRQTFAAAEAKRFMKFFDEKDPASSPLTKERFSSILTDTASSIDVKRTWPLTASMLLVGTSVGVSTPAMPFVVQNLGLAAGEYGLVVSAFALAKMTGNIPFAVMVERHGRKVSNVGGYKSWESSSE
jgi:hypothetical protein